MVHQYSHVPGIYIYDTIQTMMNVLE